MRDRGLNRGLCSILGRDNTGADDLVSTSFLCDSVD